jgi:hypothetical protein
LEEFIDRCKRHAGKIGVLERWSIGVLEYWSIGVLEYWSIGVLGYWGVLEWDWRIGPPSYIL